MKSLLFTLMAALLAGCSYQMQLMPRDSGKIYPGSIQSDGMGGGSLSVQLDGKVCSGTFVTVSSNETYGFAQTYGSRGATTSLFSGGSAIAQYKALLACSDNTGLRCDVSGSSNNGGGVCVDSSNRVYDMMYKG